MQLIVGTVWQCVDWVRAVGTVWQCVDWVRAELWLV
jgi:hypothetical protein